jgi:hypothetical protein
VVGQAVTAYSTERGFSMRFEAFTISRPTTFPAASKSRMAPGFSPSLSWMAALLKRIRRTSTSGS